MSNTKLELTTGFTPVIDSLLLDLGVYPALIYGRVWRYCQMGKNGICTASQQTIADGLGLSRKAVNVNLQLLVREDYLEDLTPERKKRPHHYRDTGKANTRVKTLLPDSDYQGGRLCEKDFDVTNTHNICNAELHPNVTGGYTKKASFRNTSEETTVEAAQFSMAKTGLPTSTANVRKVDANRIFADITGMATVPGDISIRNNSIRVIEDLFVKHQNGLVAYLKPFFLAQINARSKSSGSPYSRWSLFWLTDWAVSADIPDYVLRQLDDSIIHQMGEPWITKAAGVNGKERLNTPTPEELYLDLYGEQP